MSEVALATTPGVHAITPGSHAGLGWLPDRTAATRAGPMAPLGLSEVPRVAAHLPIFFDASGVPLALMHLPGLYEGPPGLPARDLPAHWLLHPFTTLAGVRPGSAALAIDSTSPALVPVETPGALPFFDAKNRPTQALRDMGRTVIAHHNQRQRAAHAGSLLRRLGCLTPARDRDGAEMPLLTVLPAALAALRGDALTRAQEAGALMLGTAQQVSLGRIMRPLRDQPAPPPSDDSFLACLAADLAADLGRG